MTATREGIGWQRSRTHGSIRLSPQPATVEAHRGQGETMSTHSIEPAAGGLPSAGSELSYRLAVEHADAPIELSERRSPTGHRQRTPLRQAGPVEDDDEILWRDPPPLQRHHRYDTHVDEVVARLKEHPGRWALVE